MVTQAAVSYMPEGKIFIDAPNQDISVDRQGGLANIGLSDKVNKKDEIDPDVEEDEIDY